MREHQTDSEGVEQQYALGNTPELFHVSINNSGQIDIKKSENAGQDEPLNSLSELVISLVVGNNEKPIRIVAAVASNTDFIDQFVSQVQLFNSGDLNGLRDVIKGEIIANNVRFAKPVLVDYEKVTKVTDDQNDESSLFDDWLLTKGRKMMDRIRLLLMPVIILLLLLALIFMADVFFLLGIWQITHTHFSSLTLFSSIVAIVSLPLLTVLIINAFLPNALKLQFPRIEKFLKSILNLLGEKIVDGIKEGAKNILKNANRWSLRRWVGYHLLGDGFNYDQIVIIGIKNVDVWREQDLQCLGDIAADCYSGQRILLLLHMTDRSMIPSALLHALYYKYTDSQCVTHWQKKLNFDNAAIVDFNDTPSLINLVAEPCNNKHYLSILGGDESNDLFYTLIHQNWSFFDVLPAVVLGSTSSAQMSFQYTRTQAFEQYKKELSALLTPYYQLYSGHNNSPEINGITVDNVFESAKQAQGILAVVERRDMESLDKLVGRCGYRRHLAVSLLSAVGEDQSNLAQCNFYLYKLLACGELSHLKMVSRCVHEFRIKPKLKENFFSLLSFHVEAIRILTTERQSFECAINFDAEFRRIQESLMQNWLEVNKALSQDFFSVKQLPESEWHGVVQLYCAFLGALQAFNDLYPVEETSQLSVSSLMEHLRTLIINPGAEADEHAQSTSIQKVFINRVCHVIQKLRYVDSDYAVDLLEQKFSQDWYLVPEVFKKLIKNEVFANGCMDLCSHLLAAENKDMVKMIVKNHRHRPVMVISQFSVIAARYVALKFREDPDVINVHLAHIGKVINQVKLIVKDADIDLLEKTPIPLFSKTGDGKSVFDFFQDEKLCRVMFDCFAENKKPGHTDLVGFTYGAFSGLNDVIEELVEVKFLKDLSSSQF